MSLRIAADVHSAEALSDQLVRELVERYPVVMPVLARYGLDLCCGGGHTLVEAAQLHGLDRDGLLHDLEAAIQNARK